MRRFPLRTRRRLILALTHDALLSPATTYPTRDTKNKNLQVNQSQNEHTIQRQTASITRSVSVVILARSSALKFLFRLLSMLWDEEPVDECSDKARSRCTDPDGLQRVLDAQIQSPTQTKYSGLRNRPIDVKLILKSKHLTMAQDKTATELQLPEEKC